MCVQNALKGGQEWNLEAQAELSAAPWTRLAPSNHEGFAILEHPSSPPLSNQVSGVQMSPPLP